MILHNANKISALEGNKMNELKDQVTTKYVCCHNGDDIHHFVKLEPGMDLASGQPYIAIFDTLQEMVDVFGDIVPDLDGVDGDGWIPTGEDPEE